MGRVERSKVFLHIHLYINAALCGNIGEGSRAWIWRVLFLRDWMGRLGKWE